ncbi:MAG: RpiB/LacA/LacB family sugar-phosphate isomerase [Desulfurococcaceae archaeon]
MELLKVAVGSDDDYYIARFIVKYLESKGVNVVPIGALKTGKPYPWPDVGFEVGVLVSRSEVDFGIVICYTGTGVSIAANKVKGVRAALVTDSKNAAGARSWNDANVLALSARLTSEELAKEIIDSWMSVREADPSEWENISKLRKLEEER